MGPEVTLVSSAAETAQELYRVLHQHDLLRDLESIPQYEFFATGEVVPFTKLAQRFLGPMISGNNMIFAAVEA
jgi:glutamate racemase